MKRRALIIAAASLMLAAGLLLTAFAEQPKSVPLPAPKLDASKSLDYALKARKTTREFATTNLSKQMLSNLLWAAFGINRPDSGRRTAPSAHNWQEIDIYVATPDGMYRYDPKGHALIQVVAGDIRSQTYTQSVFKSAPVDLVYVSDLAKMASGDEAGKTVITAMDMGYISQNVYLYCAVAGLNTGFRVSIDKEKLGKTLKLSPTQKIMGAQSVGIPKHK
jgi:SagB-type dehydrogenase family enzyme